MTLRTSGWKTAARPVLVAMVSLVAAYMEVGAGVQDDLKAGANYEKQHQFFRAAQAYSRSLLLKPGSPKARRALEQVADRAIEEKLRRAETLESEFKANEAIAELDAAGRLRDRLASLEIESVPAQGIASRREALVSRRLEALLTEVQGALDEGLWSAAVSHLQEMDALRPGSGETHERLYEVWSSWGEINLREGRLRAAAERYESAAQIPGTRSGIAAARAAAIRVGLAKAALGKGACRAAAADLRKVQQVSAGSVPEELLRQSTSCAVTCVRLGAGADTDSGVTGGQLDLLRAELRKQVRAGASEFLRLQGAAPADTEACDARTFPGVNGEPTRVGPYSATVRVTAIQIVRQPASSMTRQTRVDRGPGLDTVGSYEEYRETLIGNLSGWIMLTDLRSVGVAVPLPVRVEGQATAVWQRNPVSTITRENVYTGQRNTTVIVDVADRGKAQAEKERRQARSDLEATLIRNFAAEAAQRLLAVLDAEPAVPDSTELLRVETP